MIESLFPAASVGALNPPATVEKLKWAEESMGLVFPRDLREAYLHFDGVDTSQRWAPNVGLEVPRLIWGCLDWVNLETVVRLWNDERSREMVERASGLSFEPAKPTAPIRATMFDPLWIPIGDAGCHEHVFIDLNPGPAGTVGQLISRSLSGRETAYIAESFQSYFDRFLKAVDSGRLVAHPRWGWSDPGTDAPAIHLPP